MKIKDRTARLTAESIAKEMKERYESIKDMSGEIVAKAMSFPEVI